MSDQRRLPAVILAAGLSSRMGAFKPLLELAGQTLLMRVIESLHASQSIGEILVVTGHREQEVRDALAGEKTIRIISNTNFAAGEMLSSVKTGIAALPATPGFLLAFADQPAVLPVTITALCEAFFASHALIVVPIYSGKRGHPVIMSTAMIPEIQQLPPESSLKQVVHAHLLETQALPVTDPSVLEDLDTPEDFARAQAAIDAARVEKSEL